MSEHANERSPFSTLSTAELDTVIGGGSSLPRGDLRAPKQAAYASDLWGAPGDDRNELQAALEATIRRLGYDKRLP